MKDYIKKFWVSLAGGIILGVILQALIGIPWHFTPSLLLFMVVVNIIIGGINSNQSAKEAIKKSFCLIASIITFVGMRVVLGYLIDMPITNSYGQLGQSGGLVGISLGKTTPAIIVDILFILPGAGFAYLLVNGRKFWKGAMALISIVLMVGVIWGIKQPTHAQAIKRQIQAIVSLDANHRNNNALAKESAAASSYGIAKTAITRFYKLDTKANSIEKEKDCLELPQGKAVLQVEPGEKAHIIRGQAFTPVILPNKDGSFIGGKLVWVESNSFDWTDGGNVLSDKSSIVKSEDGKLWTINFYTSDLVKVVDNLPIGQKYIVTGAPADKLKAPHVNDFSKFMDVPMGVVRENRTASSLYYKSEPGTKITIKFL